MVYFFLSILNVECNLEMFVDFVQDLYFIEKMVEKEKGIIGQEINMYDDNFDWRFYFGVIENMYKEYFVRIDIVGIVESILYIIKDFFYECYEMFYYLSNMFFFIVGFVDFEVIIFQVRENQERKLYIDQLEIKWEEVKE